MKKIKNILVATDFSATSRGAYQYAKQFADTNNAKITLVHVIESLNIITDVDMAPYTIYLDDAINGQIENLILEENTLINKPTILGETNILIIKGATKNVLVELSEKGNYDLIIMGTTGLSDVLTNLFGSVSLSVSHDAKCPVLLIPRDVKWQPIEQIMYAANNDSINDKLIQEIANMAENLKADIHFLNIKDFDTTENKNPNTINWNKILDSVGNKVYFETHSIYGDDTVNQIETYSKEKNINIMVFVSKHRNFWQRFIHDSVTNSAVLSSNLPIMVIHLIDK